MVAAQGFISTSWSRASVASSFWGADFLFWVPFSPPLAHQFLEIELFVCLSICLPGHLSCAGPPPGLRAVLALTCPEDGQDSRVSPELLGGRGTRL